MNAVMKITPEVRTNRDKTNLWAALLSPDGLEVLSTRHRRKLRRSLRGDRILLDIRPLQPGLDWIAAELNSLRSVSKEAALLGLDAMIECQLAEICGFQTSNGDVDAFICDRVLEEYNIAFERS